MKITIPAALALLFILAGAGSSAAGASQANPVPAGPAAGQTEATQEAAILHEWPGTVPLGFNAQGRLLAYDSGRRVFEVHDLAATNAAVTGWNPAEGDGRVFGGALSADRRTLATVSEAGREQSRIQLWNALTGEQTGPAFAPSVSPMWRSARTARLWPAWWRVMGRCGSGTRPPANSAGASRCRVRCR